MVKDNGQKIPGYIERYFSLSQVFQIASLLLMAAFVTKAGAHGFIPVPLEAANALDDRMRGIRIQQAVSTFPPVEEDINTVLNNGPDINNATKRLMKRGSEILEPLHQALAKASTIDQKRYIIMLLGYIADSRSIPRIVEVARNAPPDEKLSRSLFVALGKFEQHKAINEYLEAILGNANADEFQKQQALLYYADRRQKKATTWVEQYTTEDTSPALQMAALTLAARTGDSTVKAAIAGHLSKQKIPVNAQRIEMTLLKALIEITSPEEFNQLSKDAYVSNKYKDTFDNYRQLYSGSSVQRALILQQAREKKLSDIQEAIDVLIKVNDPKPLTIHWAFGDPIIIETVHQHGFGIVIDEQGAHFIARAKEQNRGIHHQGPKAIADALVASLKNNDIAQFNAIPTLKEYEADLIEGGKKRNGLYNKAKTYSEYRDNITASWHKVVSQGRKEAIDWNRLNQLTINDKILVGPYRMQIASLDIQFEAGGKKHRIQLGGLILFDGSWRLTGPLNWVGSHS